MPEPVATNELQPSMGNTLKPGDRVSLDTGVAFFQGSTVRGRAIHDRRMGAYIESAEKGHEMIRAYPVWAVG